MRNIEQQVQETFKKLICVDKEINKTF